MLMDGIELAAGAKIQNASVDFGTTFPTADLAELFFRTSDSTLYVYTGTVWDRVSGIPNVENKSSATIRSEITSANVTTALGYTPLPNSYTPAWSAISGKPTLIGNSGITDVYNKTQVDSAIAAVGSPTWATVAGKPTTIAGYAITDAYTKTQVDSAISSATPTWSSLTGKPTTIAGFGITDAYTKTYIDNAFSALGAPSWASITGKPTTIAGYGITNAYTKTEVDSAIAVSGAPAWNNITGKPTLIANSGITDVYSKTQVDSAISSASGSGQTIRNTTPGVLTTLVSPVRLYPSATMTLISVMASVSTASTGADIKVDIRKNGTSILGGNLLTITLGTFKSSVIANTTQITTSDYITIHVTQVGSIIAGADLVTSIYFV
jgi:hypothetical protein